MIVRKRRTASDFRRIYGSKQRAATMAMRPCDWCSREPTEDYPNHNAHTENGGRGRKAGWQTVVTLCAKCHAVVDGNPAMRAWLKETAKRLAKEILP